MPGFPVIVTSTGTNGTSASATPVVTIGAAVANQLVIVLFRTAIGTAGVGWPAGWTELAGSSADASDDAQSVGYRWTDGTEGTTITLATTSAKFAAFALRILGAHQPAFVPPVINTVLTGTSAEPEPSNLVISGSLKTRKWLWLGGWEGEQTSPPGGSPTSHTLAGGANSGTTGAVETNCRVAVAWADVKAASWDGGIWAISASDDWMVWMVAVEPDGDRPQLAISRFAAIRAASY